MKTFLKMVIATIVAMNLLLLCMALGAPDRVCLVVYGVTAMALCFFLGVFDMPEEHKTIHHEIKRAAHKDMRNAA